MQHESPTHAFFLLFFLFFLFFLSFFLSFFLLGFAPTAQLLDREASREKVLVSRMRELALKERAKSAKKPQGGDAAAPEGGEGAGGEDEEEDPIAVAESTVWDVINGNMGSKSKKKSAVAEGEEGGDAAAPAEAAGEN